MKRFWPEERNHLLEMAEEVTLEIPEHVDARGERHQASRRKALRLRLPVEAYEAIWPLAEMRFRPASGRFHGKAITLLTTNPHYHAWHPADGGSQEMVSESGRHYTQSYVVVHFLLDDVAVTVPEPALS